MEQKERAKPKMHTPLEEWAFVLGPAAHTQLPSSNDANRKKFQLGGARLRRIEDSKPLTSCLCRTDKNATVHFRIRTVLFSLGLFFLEAVR